MAEPTAAFTRHRLFADQVGTAPEVGFPFETVLSLAPVLAHWRALGEREPAIYGPAWAAIERDLASAPELSRPIDDPAALDRHPDLIDRIVRPLFPSSDWTSDARALSGPFGGQMVTRTAQYERVMGRYTGDRMDVINTHDRFLRTLYAYKAILGRFYGVTLRLDQPLIFVVPESDTGLSRYVKLNASTQFTTIEATGPLPELDPAALDDLLRHVGDLRRWTAALPPERFRFVGLTATTLTDVTNETATAAITHLVLTSDANLTAETFDALQDEVRTLFATASLRLGLASLQADGALNVQSERKVWNSLVIRDALRDGSLDWQGTPYDAALRRGEPVVLPDIERAEVGAPLRRALAARGVRSLALQPLRAGGRTVGLFELSSPEPGAADASTLLKMRRLHPVLALAVSQNLDRFETRVESAIQHAYTAIHPSVAWRFREAAITMMGQGPAAEPPAIAFADVWPLYGAADIRSSTRHRNEAVRHDTLARLDRARQALAAVRRAVPLTILDELDLRLDRRAAQYRDAWNTGDEDEAARFLAHEVEPVLERLAAGRDDLAPALATYRAPGHNGEAARAQAYETSRRTVNRTVSDVLLAEQAEAQRVFPHYFEHAKTDGVEHAMYIGASLTPDRPFDPAYVENLRLRQLIAACTVAREVRRLHATLPMALDVAQLVVVQHAPVTLRFRTDETRFDVDGAAGVRFELLKKRLDKARVAGTDERITQPDRIAVVTSTEAEHAEYCRYADYLAASGTIEGGPEVLAVEDLPGAAGLGLLRLAVRV
ncbi:GAF domain-containing protein [Rubrivirga sp. IMCC43871]|uniref:GAF domain-containing protein n=1 Tax=Rubrivirga sp. IMCC43871 TaxID=3391575 RepID=UPI00398FA675